MLVNIFYEIDEFCKYLEKIIIMRLFIAFKLKNSTGISIIDSTSIKSCHIKRACSNKTLKNISKKSITSLGWFYLNQITFSS